MAGDKAEIIVLIFREIIDAIAPPGIGRMTVVFRATAKKVRHGAVHVAQPTAHMETLIAVTVILSVHMYLGNDDQNIFIGFCFAPWACTIIMYGQAFFVGILSGAGPEEGRFVVPGFGLEIKRLWQPSFPGYGRIVLFAQ